MRRSPTAARRVLTLLLALAVSPGRPVVLEAAALALSSSRLGRRFLTHQSPPLVVAAEAREWWKEVVKAVVAVPVAVVVVVVVVAKGQP